MYEFPFAVIAVVLIGTIITWLFSRQTKKAPSWLVDKQKSPQGKESSSATEKGKKKFKPRPLFFASLNITIALAVFVFVGAKVDVIKKSKNIIAKYDKGSPISRTILASDLIESLSIDWNTYHNMSLVDKPSYSEWLTPLWDSMIKRKLTLFKIDISTRPDLEEEDFEVLKWKETNWIQNGHGEFEVKYLVRPIGNKRNKFRVWVDLALNKAPHESLEDFVNIYVRKPGTNNSGRKIDILKNSMLLGTKNGISSFFMIAVPLKQSDFNDEGCTEIIKRVILNQPKGISKTPIEFSLGSPQITRYPNGVKELILSYNFQDRLISYEIGSFNPMTLDVTKCDILTPTVMPVQDKAFWGFEKREIEEYWNYQFYAEAPPKRPFIAFRQQIINKN